ncbi:MAG: hypothetical protein WKF37_06225 [Bryobacteraceae bacterium]
MRFTDSAATLTKMRIRVGFLILVRLSFALAAQIEHVAGGEDMGLGVSALRTKLTEPFGVDFGSNGDWYICEYKGQRILRVDKAGKAHAFAGTGLPGYSGDGGPAKEATFRDPHGIVVTRQDVMYVADMLNHTVRRIDPKTGVITTVAGTGKAGFSGDGGPGVNAMFNGTSGNRVKPG